MGWLPKINRHVQVLKVVSASMLRIRPGTITGFAVDGNPIIRIRRTGEVYGNGTTGVALRTDPNENQSVTKYIPQ